jgi:hypothetical protein
VGQLPKSGVADEVATGAGELVCEGFPTVTVTALVREVAAGLVPDTVAVTIA